MNQLARAPRIESGSIGYAGRPSDIYPLFERLIQAVTPQQAAALLRHESPVVRGYLIWQGLALHPVAPDALYSLLGDSTEVEILFGCKGGRRRVSDLAFEALSEHVGQPVVQALLLRVAQDPQLGTYRVAALLGVAQHRPLETAALARTWLGESDPKLLLGAIQALQITTQEKGVPPVCALASHPNPYIRGELISMLTVVNHPCAEPALRKLTEDREDAVRERAAATYARIRQRDPVVLRRLLTDQVSRIRAGVAAALAQRAHSQDLGLLRDYLAAEPDSEGVFRVLSMKSNPEVATFLREVCTSQSAMNKSTRSSFCAPSQRTQH